MKRTLALECKEKVGKKVLLKGWMNQLRQLGKINFLILRDRSGYIQIVIEDKKEVEKLNDLQIGTVLAIEGTVQKADKQELGVEISNPSLEVITPVKDVPPVEYNKDELRAGQDTILDNKAITIRNRKMQAVFDVQATIMKSFRESMEDQGFKWFRSPVLMEAPSESGADVFEVKYFDRKAYLCQSPQIYKQIMIGAFERAYTAVPVFRAEKHHTSRHLTEITHMDAEMAFVDDYHEVLEVCETFVRHLFSRINELNADDLKLWNVTTPDLPKGKIPEVTIKEALKIIEERTGKSAKREKLDLEPDDERELCAWAKEKHNSDLLWATHFYKDKNFYTWNDKEDPDTSLSYDLLCRGIEWLSGTVRIEKYEQLVENMKKLGLNQDHYKGYLQAFQFGMPPEAGFSFGLERLTQKIFDFDNIRSATLFPRDVERLSP